MRLFWGVPLFGWCERIFEGIHPFYGSTARLTHLCDQCLPVALGQQPQSPTCCPFLFSRDTRSFVTSPALLARTKVFSRALAQVQVLSKKSDKEIQDCGLQKVNRIRS